MIQFQCKCGKKYEVPEHFAGKKVRCKKCNDMMRIPQINNEDSAVMMTDIIETSDEDASLPEKQSIIPKMSENSGLPKPLIYSFIAIGIFLVIGFLYIFVIRDTWELDNSKNINQMIRDAKQHYDYKEYDKGLKKYDELLTFVGDRELKREQLRNGYSDICQTYEGYKEKVRTYEAKIKAETKAKAEAAEKERKLVEFKSRLMALITVGEKYAAEGDVENAIQAYEEALELAHQNSLPSELQVDSELQSISKTLEDGISKLKNILAQAEATEQAQQILNDAISDAVKRGMARTLHCPSTATIHPIITRVATSYDNLTNKAKESLQITRRVPSENAYYVVAFYVDAENLYGARKRELFNAIVAVDNNNSSIMLDCF